MEQRGEPPLEPDAHRRPGGPEQHAQAQWHPHTPSLERMLTPGLDDYGYGVWISNLEIGGKS